MWLQLLCGVFVVYLTRALWRRWRYDLHKMPSPRALPLLGHTLEFTFGQAATQLEIWMRRQLEALGFPKLMRLDVGGETMVVVSDVHYSSSVVLSKTSPFIRVKRFQDTARPMSGSDQHTKLFISSIETTPYVKDVRKTYAVSMQSSQLKRALPKLNAVMEKMIDVIESKRHEGSIDFQKLCVQCALDAVGAVALDMNLGGLDGSRELQRKIIEAGHVSRENVTKPFLARYCKLFPNSSVARRQRHLFDVLTEEWDRLAKELIEKKDPPEGEMPLWYAFKTLIDPETGKPLKYESFRAELATIVVSGTDTTGHQLAWILAMFASHPRIVEKLLEELKENGLYGENARDVTFEDLGELKYLAAVIKEGFRIGYIGVFSLVRIAPQDMLLLGHRIPKDTLIVAPSNRSLYSEADWGDPDVVRPERWLTDENLSDRYFKAFSTGPRDCIGQKLAMLELRFAIVKLITQYKLSMDVSFDALLNKAFNGIVIEAKEGIWINALPRDQPNLQNA